MLPQDCAIHFRSDGVALSPAEYARLLARLAEEDGIAADEFSLGRCRRTARTAHGRAARQGDCGIHAVGHLGQPSGGSPLGAARAAGAGSARKPPLPRLRRLRPGAERADPGPARPRPGELYRRRGRRPRSRAKRRAGFAPRSARSRSNCRCGAGRARSSTTPRCSASPALPASAGSGSISTARGCFSRPLYRDRTRCLRRAVRYRLRVAIQIF